MTADLDAKILVACRALGHDTRIIYDTDHAIWNAARAEAKLAQAMRCIVAAKKAYVNGRSGLEWRTMVAALGELGK